MAMLLILLSNFSVKRNPGEMTKGNTIDYKENKYVWKKQTYERNTTECED